MYTFIDCILNGSTKIKDINSWIEFWFEGDVDGSLREFLGFTKDEYRRWVVEGDGILEEIINNHRKINNP